MTQTRKEALEAAEKLADAGTKLEKAVSEVVRLGARTGSQWTRLTVASLMHRQALAAYRDAIEQEPDT
jgi:hypothetical protein